MLQKGANPMIPIGDDNSTRRITPVVTYVLIALNVLVFFLELNNGEDFIQRWAFVPSRFLADPVGDFATLFTAMFMHAGWVHLRSEERRVGKECSSRWSAYD